jgi:DNA repair photolyase
LISTALNSFKVKSVLVKSGLPDAEWAVNSHIGCAFGREYCYAAFIGRWNIPTRNGASLRMRESTRRKFRADSKIPDGGLSEDNKIVFL